MLLAPCLRTASGTFSTPGCRAAVPLLGQTLLSHTRRHGRFISQPVLSQGFLDGVFKRGKAHAPELVRLDTDDEGGLAQTSSELFGPLALLMIGFDESEVQIFRSIMLDMDADMVKIIVCDRQMFQGTLCQAMEAPGHMHTQRVGQRAVIVSGMNAAEIGEIIGAYRDADLPEPVWAAALAANWDRKVKDLVDDIYGDHNYMMERERNAGLSS